MHNNVIRSVSHSLDFNYLHDCKMKCNFILSCGHVCNMECHVGDNNHLKIKCKNACEK